MTTPEGINVDPAYPLLREVKQRQSTRQLLERWEAHSIGIGRKIVGGEPTDQLALRVYVTRKVPGRSLGADRIVPQQLGSEAGRSDQAAAVVTDVIEAPEPRFEIDPTVRARPVPGGVSVDAVSGTAGTLGGWVWDAVDNTVVMLSNHHIFGHRPGVAIMQPGRADGGLLPRDRIGTVKRGIATSTVRTNTVDCAIGEPDDVGIADLQVVDIGPAVYAIRTAMLDMPVEKYGRTTRHTFGVVDDVDFETMIDGAPFGDCIRIAADDPSARWSQGGDSGSLCFARRQVDGTGPSPVVGLHFAGPRVGSYGVACKIENVFQALDLTPLPADVISLPAVRAGARPRSGR